MSSIVPTSTERFLRLLVATLVTITVASASASSSSSVTGGGAKRTLVIGVDGGTESVRACVFDAADGSVVGSPCAVPYTTTHPAPGHAEQDPEEWWSGLGAAVRGALEGVEDVDAVAALCVDTTCCSVVVLDSDLRPLRPCLLWMDARAAAQAERVLETCRGDPALAVNSAGEGPLSAEWMLCKALWIKEHEPEIWERTAHVCEYQDLVNQRLTGAAEPCASSCNAAARWHWDGEAALREPTEDDPRPGRPESLYARAGIPELTRLLPRVVRAPGAEVGVLSPSAARHLGLPPGVLVAQGGPDAFVGMLGLGCVSPGDVCLITGSSHLHCAVVDPATARPSPSYWGPYRGAPLPGSSFVEGGQSSTGSVLRWAKTRLLGVSNDVPYSVLDAEAEAVPVGANGLVALETFQGARTPRTDPRARGALLGLSLSHGRAHVWRALCEAVCLGTRACLEDLTPDGGDRGTNRLLVAGGATRSPFWTRMHADATGRDVVITENADAPLLGCAILASVAAGVHDNVEEAANRMVRVKTVVKPDPDRQRAYDDLYRRTYAKVAPSVSAVVRSTQEDQS